MQAPKRVWRGPPRSALTTATDKQRHKIGAKMESFASQSKFAPLIIEHNDEEVNLVQNSSNAFKGFEMGHPSTQVYKPKQGCTTYKRKNEARETTVYSPKQDTSKPNSVEAQTAPASTSNHQIVEKEKSQKTDEAIVDTTNHGQGNQSRHVAISQPILNGQNHTVVHIPDPVTGLTALTHRMSKTNRPPPN
ncbi:OLC1v1006642C1 [Oldenlandia corymbosa var. corymbosa]|uniref:OLC1v1006642C1 n=1 Tax=Oldenlandia corymbosa var. corymbosa TaxID=529605 RepID=A0AAV1DJQ1_OLDCO|nr:OLC1v1006642C1 [Oldenlandia corymbosa var. corymbosa]